MMVMMIATVKEGKHRKNVNNYGVRYDKHEIASTASLASFNQELGKDRTPK